MSVERSRAGRPTSVEAARLTERLRRAAVDTFLEHGYDGTTMEAVAQAAGITKSTLYARYPDKRTLFIAVSAWALTRQERDERVLEPLPDDLAASLAMIARAILARSVDPDIVRLSRMAIAESDRFPEFAASSQAATWSPRIGVIMDLLRRHEQAGTVVVDNIELAAEQFFAMVGAMPAWLAAYGIYRTPEVEEEHMQHAVRLFLNGLLTRDDTAAGRPPSEDARHREGPDETDGGTRPETAAVRTPATGTAAIETAAIRTAAIATATTRTAADGARRDRAAAAGSPEPMEYRRLGRSGLYVSPLALGTMAFGADRGCDERTAAALVDRFLDAGGNLLDTADVYGAAEAICGRVLRGRRSRVVLATRAGTAPDRGTHGGGNSRRHLRAACDASLRRLGTEYIDLYQLNLDDLTTPLDETVDALDDLVRAGKVLYVGASNFHAYRLMKALAVSDRLGRARFSCLRGHYDLTARRVEREYLPLLAEEGLGFISAGPFTTGSPTPPPDPGARSGQTQPGGAQRGGTQRAVALALAVAAAELGCSTTQLALAWQWTRPVSSAVVDARTVGELEDALAALRIEIPTEIATELEKATPPPEQ